jgi:membrane-associated phospholipid phosphatase
MMKMIKRIAELRLEELFALLFLIPSSIVTLIAYSQYSSLGRIPRGIEGGLWRILVVMVMFGIIHITAIFQNRHKFIKFLRDVLPFGLAIMVYTNLHDTIGFVNSGDISGTIMAIEEWIFGGQPILWAERFYHPLLTEVFTFCYLNFFAYSISLGGLIYFTKPPEVFREVMLGVVLLFYGGYFFYIIFPCVPPRLVMLPYFTKTLDGGMMNRLQDNIVNVGVATSRAAFPSLHCANTLINLLYSWKYKREFFWAFLPIATGLVIATVYLRHHWVVDIIAGFLLAVFIFWITPKADRFWRSLRKNQ